MDQLLKVEIVAERLGLRPPTVWRMIRERRIASTKIGRARRVPATEIARLIAEGMVLAEPRDEQRIDG